MTVAPYLASNAMDIAIIGGGRWGKVLCKALARSGRVRTIHVVSRRNFRGMDDWIADQHASPRIAVHDNVNWVLERREIQAAFVANLPAEHFATSKQLLEHGKHVLVEKPLVPACVEADALIAIADANGLVLAAGLEFLFASYVHYLKETVARYGSPVEQCEIIWHDAAIEEKWGSTKSPETTTSVVGDLFPHVLTFLTVLLGPQETRAIRATSADGGLCALLDFSYGPSSVRVSFSRAVAKSQRTLKLFTANGRVFALDFTREPGTVSIDGEKQSEDRSWQQLPKPLDAEVECFLEEIQQRSGALPNLAKNTSHIVQGTADANAKIREQQVILVRRELLQDYPRAPSNATLVALREHLAGSLLNAKLVESPKDQTALARWTRLGFQLIHKLSGHPFTAQRELSADLGLSADVLKRLNAAVRESDFAQELIVNHGRAVKYWYNTIIPLIQSGSIEAARQRSYRYPFRVGIYPGPSCMFFCTFCGRNKEARYDHDAIQGGNERFKTLFKNAPANDPHTFYVSGGLEPLTNPGIGELIRCGARQGFKLSLYTNGFTLTPRLLERQSGFWGLNTLRISVYGVDCETTESITRKQRSFVQVIKNARDFLQLRNERNSPMQFGFNFVILPGRAEQVLRLAEVIAKINRHAGGRQIDFLTLREDYSLKSNEAISAQERSRTVDIFAQLEERSREPDLRELYIDYGYALHAIREGKAGGALEMAEDADIRSQGYPQVSVVVDLLGDVYLYREAGFPDRAGASRYIIGRITRERPFEKVLADFIKRGEGVAALTNDTQYFDIFDHVVTKLLNQADADEAFGIPFDEGPVRGRVYGSGTPATTLAHPTIARL